jgi:hypothetical protein
VDTCTEDRHNVPGRGREDCAPQMVHGGAQIWKRKLELEQKAGASVLHFYLLSGNSILNKK